MMSCDQWNLIQQRIIKSPNNFYNIMTTVWSVMGLQVVLWHIEGLAQDCSNFIAYALKLLQSWAKPSICKHTCSRYMCVSMEPKAFPSQMSSCFIASLVHFVSFKLTLNKKAENVYLMTPGEAKLPLFVHQIVFFVSVLVIFIMTFNFCYMT